MTGGQAKKRLAVRKNRGGRWVLAGAVTKARRLGQGRNHLPGEVVLDAIRENA